MIKKYEVDFVDEVGDFLGRNMCFSSWINLWDDCNGYGRFKKLFTEELNLPSERIAIS